MALHRHVALLRGLNVGGANRLTMKDLTSVFEAAGAAEVSTYIQSGNVLFEAPPALVKQLPTVVATRLKARFGITSPVVLRSAAALEAVATGNPHLPEQDASSLHVAFLADTPSAKALAALDPQRFAPDVFVAQGRELYLLLPNGVGRSKLTNAYFDRALDTVSTVRNWKTVLALRELLAERK